MSGAGITIETWQEKDGDIIFDPEVTPNRIDWLSVTGIAREVAAVTGEKFSLKKPVLPIKKLKDPLKINVKPDYKIVPRVVSIIIRDIKIKSSPEWLQKRIKQIGLHPINNLVDITNYVLWEYASPLHVFDYDTIRGKTMAIHPTLGGEGFRSLDGLNYTLPKDAIAISDVGRVIDLPPIKGGQNTAVSSTTKTVLLHSLICNPVLTRHASQKLGLRSDTSAISERGIDPNILPIAVARATELIIELAGGEIASEIMDHKETEFKPWAVEMSHSRLEKVIGINFSQKEVIDSLNRLNLTPTIKGTAGEITYSVTVPTFRPDVKLEEDIIEEIARLHGMNSLPRTLPNSAVPTSKVAYLKNYDLEFDVKTILKGAGFSEIFTYSLVSEKQLTHLELNPEKTLRVDNSISKEYEYLRPDLMGNLLDAVKLNQPNFPKVRLFELGKIYTGPTIDRFDETYELMGVISGDSFFECKGVVEHLARELGITVTFSKSSKEVIGTWFHPGRCANISVGKDIVGTVAEIHPNLLQKFAIKDRVAIFTLHYDHFVKHANREIKYQLIPKYPSISEDLSLIFPENVSYQEVVDAIKQTSSIIKAVTLIDVHDNTKTLRLIFQDPAKNLSNEAVAKIKAQIEDRLKQLKVKPKD